MKRLLRPDAELYLIGNKKKGWVCYKPVLEAWEEKYPCYSCSNHICDTHGVPGRKPCIDYTEWLKLSPLKRIGRRRWTVYIVVVLVHILSIAGYNL